MTPFEQFIVAAVIGYALAQLGVCIWLWWTT